MKKYDKTKFGTRLRELREDRHISQDNLALELQLSNASISNWETGKQIPTAEAIFKLADYFDVSADYLLGLIDEW